MTDNQFAKAFFYMVALLAALTVALVGIGILMASDVDTRMEAEKQLRRDRIIAERIAPAGTLAVGEQAAAEAAEAAVAPAVQVAEAGEVSGEAVYNVSCVACHGPGIAGAPALGKPEAWTERISRGMETLVENAINGYQGTAGFMPAKGGNPSLSDAQVRAAVEYMVENSR